MKITLDRNCMIDWEKGEGAAADVSQLLAYHESGIIDIQIPGISASERLEDRTYASTFGEFRRRVRKMARREIEILKPLVYINITFVDWSIIPADDHDIDLASNIQKILFPGIEFNWVDFAASRGLQGDDVFPDPKWRNKICDTLALWCHIHYGSDIFVTRDDKFHQASKKPRLEKLGARAILFPAQAVAQVIST